MPNDRLDAAGHHRGRAGPTTSAFTRHGRVHAAQVSGLPQELEDAVPRCARQCLAGYIEQGWTCSDSNSGCLCSEYSSQGFTLGELAYICLQQECGQSSHDRSVAAYQICQAEGDAVTATHSTLTVPARTTTSNQPTSARTGSRPILESSGGLQASRTFSTQTSPAETAISSMSSASATPAAMASTASTTTSASAGAAGARNDSKPTTSLSTAEAIGISVACMGVVVLAIGIFYLVVCLRRRKVKVRDEKRERDSYDFVDEAPPRFSPFHYGYADPRGPLGGFYGQRAELTSEKRNSQWYRDHFLEKPEPNYGRGFEFSPKSMQSRSTISQLLPDKPKATPPQMRTKPSPRPLSSVTVPTVFEEDKSPQMFPAMFPPPVGLPAHPKAFHYPNVARPPPARYTEQVTQSPSSMRQPPLSIQIPKQAARVVKSPAQAHVPAPYLRQRSPVKPEQRVSDARSSRSAASFLNYYASPEANAMRSPESPTPIDDNVQTRRAVPTAITVTKPTYPPRAVRVTSGASDTSFESTDPDEPTPPDEEDKQLTPVKEHSPIAGIKYPKVPRSSNQAIPRSPIVKTPPSIGAKISPAPKQTRRPNALPAGAHARPSPRRPQDQAGVARPQGPMQRPRPTSQIPRKPVPSHQPRQQPVTPERQVHQNSNLSGSTLAAKRRGDNAAHDMEQGLRIKNSSHSTYSRGDSSVEKPLPPSAPATRRSPHNSPLKGYGRVASRNNSPVVTRPPGFQQGQQGQQAQQPVAQRRYPVRPTDGSTGYRQPGAPGSAQQNAPAAKVDIEEPLKSPPWEPKLTPSRKGEDLYLSVGSATPKTEAFERYNMGRRSRGM